MSTLLTILRVWPGSFCPFRPAHDTSFFVTTHVVRLKLFRPKAEGVRKAQLTHFGGERADSHNKHGFKMSRIPVFPNSLQPRLPSGGQASAYPPEQLRISQINGHSIIGGSPNVFVALSSVCQIRSIQSRCSGFIRQLLRHVTSS